MTFNPITYFTAAAKHHKMVKHSDSSKRFFRLRSLSTIDELIGSLNKANFPAIMVHDLVDGAIGDFAVSDVYLDTPQVIWYVVKDVPFRSTDADVSAAITTCHQIGQNIIAGMIRHRRKGKHGLQFVDLSRIPYQSVGPIGDNVYGMMYMLDLTTPLDLQFNENDWTEIW